MDNIVDLPQGPPGFELRVREGFLGQEKLKLRSE